MLASKCNSKDPLHFIDTKNNTNVMHYYFLEVINSMFTNIMRSIQCLHSL